VSNTSITATRGTQNVKLKLCVEKEITTFLPNVFKVFTVDLQTMVLVKFLTRRSPLFDLYFVRH
jgi:hypothetical protein